jgi:hypothetical protein
MQPGSGLTRAEGPSVRCRGYANADASAVRVGKQHDQRADQDLLELAGVVERAVDRAFELQFRLLAGEQPESCQSFRLEIDALKAA